MASAFQTKRRAWRVGFTGHDGRRAMIHLGTVGGKRHAEEVRRHVEELLSASGSGASPDRNTSAWLGTISDALYGKLAAVGLVSAREASTAGRKLGEVLQAIIDRRVDLSPSGKQKLVQARAKLIERFGASRDIRSITPAEARDFSRWLFHKHARATASAHIRKIKAMFADSVERRLIDVSPFAKIKGASEHNSERMRYITRADFAKVLDALPDATWRLAFALARFAGLRVPSELRLMKWTDINWSAERMLIRSPKTARSGKPTRLCPIFPELLPYLREAFEAADAGAVLVFGSVHSKTNLRKMGKAYIERAGLEAWPKLFQNLRASCETDLCKDHPIHVACAWIGNTVAVAAKHYAMVTDADFERAAKGVAKAPPQRAETEANGKTDMPKTPEKPEEPEELMAPAGVELLPDSLEKPENSQKGSRKVHRAPIGTHDPDAWGKHNHALIQSLLRGYERSQRRLANHDRE